MSGPIPCDGIKVPGVASLMDSSGAALPIATTSQIDTINSSLATKVSTAAMQAALSTAVYEYQVKPTDSVSAINAMLVAAAGKTVLFQAGVYSLTTALTYDTTLGPLQIVGHGVTLRATGTSNKCLYVTGTTGVTANTFRINGIAFESTTSGICAAGLHLDGIARFTVKDCTFGSGSKMAYGLRCTGSQQGEVSGCSFGSDIGTLYEISGAVGSNGIHTHSCTYFCPTKNAVYDRVDSGDFYGNHLTSAPVSIDVVASGYGILNFNSNHIEQHTTAGIRSAGTVINITGNSFFHDPGGSDIVLTGTQQGTIVAYNLLSGSLNFGSSVDRLIFQGNTLTNTGTITNSSTNIQSIGNIVIGAAGTFGATGGKLNDKLSITSRDTTAGEIFTANPNSSVSGAWGVAVYGAGSSQEVYLKLNGPVVSATTSGGFVSVKDGVGGTEWIRFFNGGLQFYNGSGAAEKQSFGTGSPEGVVTGNKGDLFFRTDGSAGTCEYVKETTGGNTGWVASGIATTLATARAIYGNNFDGSAALTQIIASTYGGTGNGFTKLSGPTTTEKTKTLRDATDTILELGGSYTPTGTWTNMVLATPTLGDAVATSLLVNSNVLLAKSGIYPGVWLGQTLGTYSLTNYAFLLDPGNATLINTPSGTTLQFRVANGTIATINASGLSAIGLLCSHPTNGIGYTTGAGGTVTQTTSRTTPVTLNKTTGEITLVSAAGSASWQTFTVNNSAVTATDFPQVIQKSGTDKYQIFTTRVAAGVFDVTFATTGGTTTEQPVFRFNVLKGATS